ncbi:MAG: nicotinamide riboside transporter PnuC [Bacteroidales bacterium]|nr:nicotinamide mononucleotide transporter [Lentimicrobiaceae bacterium]MDD5694549.1 nicotinamide riboside transporter PnuC [Bacteroidales bacterium]
MNTIINDLALNILDTSWIEYVAVIFGILSVWFARKENILVYPTGIINVLIFVYLCYDAGLYANMGINIFYFFMSVYGWYSWTRKDANAKTLAISRCGLTYGAVMIALLLVLFILLRYVLMHYTDSTVPIVDAFTTAVFIIGMWLMARKKVENWIAWIIGDVICIPLYAFQGLIFSSLQFLIFLIIAIMGYISWRRKSLSAATA